MKKMTDQILVIDDEPDAEDLFKQHFRREIRKGQLELVFANSGETAIQLLDGETEPSAHAVFSDIKMPGMSGLDVLKAIKDRWPNIPVYMITAFGSDEMEQKVLNMGACGFFTKPLNFSALSEVISTEQSE